MSRIPVGVYASGIRACLITNFFRDGPVDCFARGGKVNSDAHGLVVGSAFRPERFGHGGPVDGPRRGGDEMIGSLAHRVIGSLKNRPRSTWLGDEPMTRWPDEPIHKRSEL
jgi:hypothetical protein